MKKIHVKLYNKQMQFKAYLENAYNIKYDPPLNELWTAGFSLPFTDPKREEIETFDYVELYDNGKRIGMFRIMDSEEEREVYEKVITYDCEHVLSTLMDSVLFGYHERINLTTRENIEYLLSKQRIKHWKLGKCDFVKYFQYSWENEETLLGPIYSIPKPFDEKFQWTWDDTSYPWTLNLVKYSDEITGELRYRKNMRGIKRKVEAKDVMTRVYPLGYGEGVNQLTIKSVNNGIPYIDAPDFVRELHDGFDYIWVDRKIEDAKTLYASANSLLLKACMPKITYEIDAIDYELIDPYKIEKYETGKLVRLYDEDFNISVDLRVMDRQKDDVTGNPLDVKLVLENKVTDLGTIQADIEKRQKVNEVYSQGTTNIDSQPFQDNCDPDHPAIIRFQIPNDVKNVNQLILTFETLRFRAYERAIKGGGAVVGSTSAGGGTVSSTSAGGSIVQSTSSGGSSTQTSTSGGGSVQTSSGGGDHVHKMFHGGGIVPAEPTTIGLYTAFSDPGRNTAASFYAKGTGASLYTHGSSGDHTHSLSIPNHQHSISIPSHQHSISLPNHQHDIHLDPHSHEITLPNHTHDIEFGIFELYQTPSKVTIEVDGNTLPFDSIRGQDINLIPYLAKDTEGKLQRGRYVEIKITPNSLARINATVTGRLFIQSRSGGTY
ncbi:phage tail spike protein [Bacillus cereus group sp. TH243-1LC]|uniref:phage tail spike protein n=1 Tax=Bacillus cereus group sp. TH243-1LC TaxID=3018046 RepID=UPI0022E7F32D|nr:phage tail spike protein [Bacillus cereus group sp. TH243-1LC]MDA1564000.1 phage tail protein [Bacillus cereus group sp. TH243-1LC]